MSRIETQLKNTKFEYLLQDCFGGKVSNQMICQGGCNKIREREQDFQMISLPIKGRESMCERLESHEMLDGVNCDHCNKKTQTERLEVLKELPNTMFFI